MVKRGIYQIPKGELFESIRVNVGEVDVTEMGSDINQGASEHDEGGGTRSESQDVPVGWMGGENIRCRRIGISSV
jgi:hypothetical protein